MKQFNTGTVKYIVPLLLAFAFLIVGIITLSDYGINWDAPGRMIRGQIYLDKILHTKSPTKEISPMIIRPETFATRFDPLDGEEGNLITLPKRPLFKQTKGESFYRDGNFDAYYMSKVEGHPPLIDILSALSNRILFEWTNLFNDIDSYKVVYVLFASLGVFIVSAFTYEIAISLGFKRSLSSLMSLIAGLTLALFPIYFSEAHFNMKDPIQASFFAGSIWSFWHWIRENKARWFVSFMLFSASALGVKWNIGFLPFIILPWLFSIRRIEEFRNWFKPKLLTYGFIFLVFNTLFLILIWPPAWSAPFKIFHTANYYLELGTKPDQPVYADGFITPLGFNLYPAFLLLVKTPEITLLLFVLGIIALIRSIKSDRFKIGILMSLWVIIPIIRISLPHVFFYNGIRQIMEVMPAIAIVAGVGAGYLLRNFQFSIFNFQSKFKFQIKELLFCSLIFILLLIPIIRLHPNENVYFNNLVGGLKGMYDKNLLETKIKLTFGNTYKQAADWINKNVEKDANIALLRGPSFALSPLFLRPDISISPFHFSGFEQKGEYILDRYSTDPWSVFASLYPKALLKPVHEIIIDDVTLITIYKNSPEFLKPSARFPELTTSEFRVEPKASEQGRYLEVDLGKKVRVTRVIVRENKFVKCYSGYSQFIDEYIYFDTGERFGPHEIREAGNGEFEFLFPAVESRFIKIFPLSQFSCITKGLITKVKYLSLE